MKFILLIILLTSVSALNIRSGIKKEQKETICKELEHPRCVKWDNNTQTCYNMDCWKYDSIKEECLQDGKSWLPAIILQSIPFTGVFGSGFGNIGRWDLFSMYIGIVFGPLVLLCVVLCIIFSQDNYDNNILVQCCYHFISCLYALTLITFWIWGIVVIASKEVEAPWTDHAGKTIMCPLV